VPSCDQTWHEVQLSGNIDGGLTLGQSIEQGETVIVVPGIATAAECSMLAIAAKRAADGNQRISGVPSSGGDLGTHAAAGRIPSVAAAESCARAGAACVAPLPIEADCMADSILNRVLKLIDQEMPTLVTTLFGPAAESLVCLREMGALVFHAREPAFNVYDAGGEFLPHMDHEALTVLIPLNSPDEPLDVAGGSFTGGGTGFWQMEHANGARSMHAATVVLRPTAGTALIFGGHATHAGMPVVTGTRVCFVASFTALTYDYDFWGPRPRPPSCYHDVE